MMSLAAISLTMSSTAPMSTSFLVTILSIIVSMLLMVSSGASIAPTAMVISFSSGMMILFCYCSMLTVYEENKKSWSMSAIFLSMSPLLITLTENSSTSSESSSAPQASQSMILIYAMAVVAITMMSINKSVFFPQKSLLMAY